MASLEEFEMKKIVLALAIASIATTPAFAQFCDNANCTRNVQQAYDPAYQAAVRSGGNYGYDGGYVPFAPLLGLVLGHHSRKPSDGETRTLPDGTTISFVKAEHRWVIVERPSSQPRGVYTDRDVYLAK